MEQIGYLSKPHGWHGMIKVIPLKGKEEKFLNLHKVYLSDGNGSSRWVEINEIKPYTRGRFLLKVNGLNKREEVEKFSNYVIYI